MKLELIIDFINNKIPEKPHIAIILGSGLGGFIDNLQNSIIIPYSEIPNFPISSVSGHEGAWVFGYIFNIPVICASGRFHIYEGYKIEEVTIPVSTVHGLGCNNLIITNSSGCLNQDWDIGDFMLFQGYIDYTFRINKKPPSIININNNLVSTISPKKINAKIRQGIYAWTLGPTYETPAEVQNIISLGGNAVGMSTVPEIMQAIDLGLNILGIACLTNYGAGIENKKLSHIDVLKVSSEKNKIFSELIKELIKIN